MSQRANCVNHEQQSSSQLNEFDYSDSSSSCDSSCDSSCSSESSSSRSSDSSSSPGPSNYRPSQSQTSYIKSEGRSKKKEALNKCWNSDDESALSANESDNSNSSSYSCKYPNKPVNKNRKRLIKRRKDLYLSEDENDNYEEYNDIDENNYSSDSHKKSANTSADEQRRQANRRTKAAISYKETTDEQTGSDELIDTDKLHYINPLPDDKSEIIERILDNRIGRIGATGASTTIYSIEENCDPNANFDPNATENGETQYLIKWKTWAHIHNTWESENSLKEQNVKGLKKLDNYKKKQTEIDYWKKYASPEDIDYFECKFELNQELLNSYTCVERIIAEEIRLENSSHDFFVKWLSLPYSEATWEDYAYIQKKWPEKVAEFYAREQSITIPSKGTKVLKIRPQFIKVNEQPDYMGLQRGLSLRDYQMDGLNWLIYAWCKENSVILADEMGLGKTIQTICFLNYLFHTHQLYGPFLCVIPLSTMTSWQREFSQWAPDLNVVTYLGDVTSRDIIRQFEWSVANGNQLKFNAILTTYEIALKDKVVLNDVNWAILLVDEAHRLKNDDSLLYKALMEFHTNQRLLITGTPLQNSLKELWALLHFIMPKKFDSWEDFEMEHGNAAKVGYSKLHKQLEPYILRRVKKDVEKSLPAKVEQILRVEMTSLQKQYYKWILTKNFNALRKGVNGSTSTFLNIVIELKKCCNHTLLVKPNESESNRGDDAIKQLLKGSGKLVLLDKLLVRLRETGHRVLIFSQMVRMLDIISEYLQKKHFPFQRLDGSIKGELRKQALDHFNAENSTDFCFLLSTRAGGLGINLSTADTVIIFDSDWNPQNDLQAQARAHRIGQKNQVNIYRLVTARSVEEEIVERAKKKMVLDHLVIQRMDTTGRTVLDKKTSSSTTPFNKEDLTEILKFGAEELFKDEEDRDEEPTCDIDAILERAETRDENPSMGGDELLSAFKVASFVAVDVEKHETTEDAHKNWTEIIPENVRKKIEEEEKSKEMNNLFLPPRSRKTMQNSSNLAENEEITKRTAYKRPKSNSSASEEQDDDSEQITDDERPRKRGRPPLNARGKIKGFTDVEIRRFIKSFKKFPNPLKRLNRISIDADLNSKPLNDIKKLAELLHDKCSAYLSEMSSTKENNSGNSNKRNATNMSANTTGKRGRRIGNRGPTFKIGGVAVNTKSLVNAFEELSALDAIIPNSEEEKTNWVFNCKTKPAHFDIEWDIVEDSKLLLGICEYGLGSWHCIKSDEHLGLSDKILNDGNKKPQVKHLQTRAEYLLKLVKKQFELLKTEGRKRKSRAKAVKESSENIDDNFNLNKDRSELPSGNKIDSALSSTDTLNSNLNKKEKRNKKQYDTGPMHFTANNKPRSLNVIVDLDTDIFNECKEKMRPVKKALKALDNPDEGLSENEQLNQTRICLLQIGDRINNCLQQYSNNDEIREWRSRLWYFVSKFTEFDAKKLHKLYKHASRKNEKNEKSDPNQNSTNKNSYLDESYFMNDNSNNSTSSNKEYFSNSKTEQRHEDEHDRDYKSNKYSHHDSDRDQSRDRSLCRDYEKGRDHDNRDTRKNRDKDRDYRVYRYSDRNHYRERDLDRSFDRSHSREWNSVERDRYQRYEDYKSRHSGSNRRLFSESSEKWLTASDNYSSSNDQYSRSFHHRDRRFDNRRHEYDNYSAHSSNTMSSYIPSHSMYYSQTENLLPQPPHVRDRYLPPNNWRQEREFQRSELDPRR